MTTTEMDVVTDDYAKSDASSYPVAEKLRRYNEADGILNGLIISDQEDRGETETVVNTVAGQRAYDAPARNHHVGWLKVDYGPGFIPARYMDERDLISWFGAQYETVLAGWDTGYPIYYRKNTKFYVYPVPSATTAGTGRLKYSTEEIPAALVADGSPSLVPVNFHHLHPAYAAMSWLDEDDPLWKRAKRKWDEGVALMLQTMYPNAQQRELVARIPEDEEDVTYSTSSGVSSSGGGAAGNYADAETPSGAIDGVNVTYTLLHAPNPATSMILVLNGQFLTQGVDYTISGVTITMLTPIDIIFASDPFLAFYRY